MQPINPRIDIVFKKIFGVEENKDLLISLINSIVSEEDQVADVILLNPYNPKNFLSEKLSILDIKAKAVDGKRYNIEIQITDEADYDKRALYYWAKLYTEQLKTGQDYAHLSKAIGIHILNFTSILGTDEYHNVFHIKEKKSNIEYFKDLELHTIELKKFSSSLSVQITDLVSKIQTALDLWVVFLTRHDLLNNKNLPDKLNQETLQKALNVLEIMSFTSEEREAYEAHLKWYQIEANTLKKVEARGEARGIEIGEARGEARGIAMGEKIALEKMLRNMLTKGCDLQLISQITGITVEELNRFIITCRKTSALMQRMQGA